MSSQERDLEEGEIQRVPTLSRELTGVWGSQKSGENRECLDCDEILDPNSEPFKTRCMDCFISKADTNRPCVQCGEKRILQEAPEWKKYCNTCFKADRESNWRCCPTCKGDRASMRTVRINSPSTFCHRCIREEKVRKRHAKFEDKKRLFATRAELPYAKPVPRWKRELEYRKKIQPSSPNALRQLAKDYKE